MDDGADRAQRRLIHNQRTPRAPLAAAEPVQRGEDVLPLHLVQREDRSARPRLRAAMLVHFTLSIAYAVLLGWLVSRLTTGAASLWGPPVVGRA